MFRGKSISKFPGGMAQFVGLYGMEITKIHTILPIRPERFGPSIYFVVCKQPPHNIFSFSFGHKEEKKCSEVKVFSNAWTTEAIQF